MELRRILLRRFHGFLLAVALLAAPAIAAAEDALRVDALRVVTYNIHAGLGGTFALRRAKAAVEENLRAIARAIVAAAPRGEPIDLVALNEVDFASRRSGWIDQAAFLADEIGRATGERYEVIRGETWRRRVPGFEVEFGNAALARPRLLRSASCVLEDARPCAAAAPVTAQPSLHAASGWGRYLRERRGVIALTLDVGGGPVDVLVTHLDAFAQTEREAQAEHLVERFVDRSRTTVLLGDMNAVPAPLVRPLFPDDRTAAILTGGALTDVRASYAASGASVPEGGFATFPSNRPLWPLDWVLASADLVPERVATIGDRESDHRGLYVKFARSRPAAEPEQLRGVGLIQGWPLPATRKPS
jgi:endonuclease/exonuclease/phosphatase family metal-dependent hydrolase